jgi:hypothetical protein
MIICVTTKNSWWHCFYMMCTLVNKCDFDFDFVPLVLLCIELFRLIVFEHIHLLTVWFKYLSDILQWCKDAFKFYSFSMLDCFANPTLPDFFFCIFFFNQKKKKLMMSKTKKVKYSFINHKMPTLSVQRAVCKADCEKSP